MEAFAHSVMNINYGIFEHKISVDVRLHDLRLGIQASHLSYFGETDLFGYN